jgi:hypothetical protein
MLKVAITTVVLSLTVSSAFALESVAKISQSTSSEEVNMEMTSEKQIVIKNAQPDAALYIVSEGKAEYLTPALVKAMAAVQESQAKQASGLELAIKILNTK